jgi:hypothetical protein
METNDTRRTGEIKSRIAIPKKATMNKGRLFSPAYWT